MAIQGQSVGTRSHSVLPASDGISLRAGLQSVAGAQLGDQFSCGNDYAPKVRKPYTVTKQRERWSEEEHKKFLEALKLYGRAWRQIEEHVGTKTAVQIRSHAQKFFFKVVRDSNGSNTSSEPMEIPPPRPKRKPMHPYPRKLVVPTNKEITAVEQPRRSASPNLSVSERENQSPTSVLFAIGSDVGGSTDSDTPNGCLSPISSAAVQPGGIPLSELNRSSKRSTSPLPALMTVGSVSDVELPVKLELLPKENVYVKEGTSEEASTRRLKLFGRTVLVTESHRPSSTSVGTGKSMLPNIHDEEVVQALPMNFLPAKSMSRNGECFSSQLQHEALGALYLTPYQKENLNLTEASSAPPTPWWTFYGGLSFPLIPFLKVEKSKAYVDCDLGEVQDKEAQKEGSWTGSTGSVNGGEDGDKCLDCETQSQPFFFKNENQDGGLVFQLRPDAKSAFSELRASPEKRVKGFMPFKSIVERETPSLKMTGQEGDEKRVRLCL